MNIFGIGLPEMALILVLALLVFGPKKLPEIGRSLGKAIKGFQEASKEFESEFKREAEQLEQSLKEPMQAKLEEPPQPVLSPASEFPAASEASISEVEVAIAGDEAKVSDEAEEIASSSEVRTLDEIAIAANSDETKDSDGLSS